MGYCGLLALESFLQRLVHFPSTSVDCPRVDKSPLDGTSSRQHPQSANVDAAAILRGSRRDWSKGMNRWCVHAMKGSSAQAPGKLTARAPQPRFYGVCGHAQYFRGLVGCALSHNAQEKYGAQNRRELLDMFLEHLANFHPAKKLLRRQAFGDQSVRKRGFILALQFAPCHRWTGRHTPATHECSIYYDSREPCREL